MTAGYNEFDEIESIAIIGMGGRFAKAGNLAEFWQNLCDGVEATTFFTAEELIEAGRPPAEVNRSNYVKARPVLKDVEKFDAAFFNIPPREAELIDPQQRVFLECAWEALEDAAYDPETYQGWIGMFAGGGATTYLINNLLPNRGAPGSSTFTASIANHREYLATRVSYKLNLKGPSVSVLTACSTSLVAAHLACQSLLSYQCDMALAGGVAIVIPQESGYKYHEGSLVAPDGHCRPFDARAQGTVFGSGAGAVVLKRLSDALEDGDHIYALIKGSAINNDGSVKVGFTAPSLDGQIKVIAMAHVAADVDPETISYIMTHGTGTLLGDPIEVEALTQAFRARTDKEQFCALGSLKGAIGHTDAAAGVANLIAATLALKHKKLPPSVNYETPNPKIDFASSPFYVNDELRDWETDGKSRLAGVSAFGVGGTNVHTILEQAPAVEPSGASRRYQQLVLSARSETALETMTDNLVAFLQANPDSKLPDVAYTLHVGRQAFENRRMVICQTVADAIEALRERDPRWVLTGTLAKQQRPVVFMFSGQGAQYVNMGRDLYQHEPFFREQVDACAELLQPHLKLDLRDVLYPAGAEAEKAAEQLSQTWLTQPALFVIEYALAQLWMSWGIKPQAMIGHSIGEYVAACLAGVFTLEDALAVVAARGRLMQSMPAGSMLSVSLAEADVQPLLNEALTVATINAPSRCVVAGPTDAITALEKRLADEGIACRRLFTSHAFHSPMMDPILEPFEKQLRQVALQAPQTPYVSNVTGAWITPKEATDPAYWAQHLRQAVRFSDGVSVLAQTPGQVLLEVGPGRTLRTLAQRHPDRAPEQIVLSSMRHPRDVQDDDDFILHALGQLWLTGVPVDWPAFYQGQRRLRLSLPTYPFERQRYWIDPPEDSGVQPVFLFKNPNIANWFYIPSWKRTMPPVQASRETNGRWLVFGDGDSLSAELARQLQAQGGEVTMALVGEVFAADGDTYTLRPAEREDYDALLATLKERDRLPTHIVHLWNAAPVDENSVDFTAQALDRSFYSLLFLAQALGAQNLDQDLRLSVISSNMQKVASDELVHPEKAALLGPCKVIPQEMTNVTARSIDVALPPAGSQQEAHTVEQLVAELQSTAPDSIVAYRGYDRLVLTYEPVALAELGERENLRLRQGGVYLITGGLGGIGLTLAEYLAQTVQARLVLTSRSRFPEPEKREQWLATHDPQDRTSLRIKTVQTLEAVGAEVLVVQADVVDQGQMEAAVRVARERFGAIHGVIHSAGLPGGGVMQLKTPQVAANVLSPKVYGTRVLEAVLRDVPLDFFILCSSLTAVSGGLGQVDYCAANAFMDAFAHARNGRNGTLTVSVNWDAWAKVGMAVNTAPTYTSTRSERALQVSEVNHPLLDNYYQETDKRTVYQMALSPEKHWVLSEHVLLGVPTVPGTTHLELARAAFAERTQSERLEIREAIFLVPLRVGEGDSKEAQLILEEQAGAFSFLVRSKAGVASNGETQWQTHVTGQLGHLAQDAVPEQYDVEAIRARCSAVDVTVTPEDIGESSEGFLRFGPRWHKSLRRVNANAAQDEGLSSLELDQAFVSDLQDLRLHPALLDIATSFIGSSGSGGGRYLPLSYKHARVYASIPGKLFSYVRRKSDSAAGDETMTLHVTLMDEQGRSVVDVEEFTLIRVDEVAAGRLRGSVEEDAQAQADSDGRYQRDFGDAILPQEGIEAFRRILFRNRLPQVAVSTRHLPTLIQRANEFSETRLIEQAAQVETTRAKYPRPNLQTLYVAPRSQVEEKLALVWGGVLGIEQVGIHDNFFELGGDSVMGIQVVAKVRDAGFHIDPEQLFQHQTIAELVEVIDVASIIQIEPDVVTGALPLTPIQHWFFGHDFPAPHHWNLVMLSEMEQDLTPSLLERALQRLLTYHDALRLRFVREESGWQSSIVEFDNNAVSFLQVDLSALPGVEQEPALEATVAELQANLNLAQGPLMRVAIFDLGAHKPNRLLTITHHLVCDAFSWWIIMDDLQTAYQQLRRGETIQFTPKTTSYKRWAERLLEYAQSEALQQELDYWLAGPRAQARRLPMDYPEGQETNIEGTADIVSATLNAQETQALLQEVPHAYRTQVNVFLLAALAEAFAQWTGERALLVDLWTHGREPIFEDVDLSRTVGWIATPFPLLLSLEKVSDPGDVLKSVKEQLHSIPNGGIGYGLLRYLSGSAAIAEKLCALPRPDVSFNYIGQSIPMPPELSGQSNFSTDPQNSRLYLLDVIVSVVEGQLEILVKYSQDVHRRHTIERLVQGFVEALQRLIQHCRELDTVHFTPSDFPEAGLDQETLDQFLSMLNKGE